MVQVDTEHLQRLVAEGYGVDLLATVLGVSDNTITGLINGGRTDRERAARIRALTRQEILTAAPERCHVPTIGAQRRIHALMRIGWSQSAIANNNRSMMRIIQGACTGEGRYMLAGTHRFIAARYDTLSMREGPSSIVRRIGERRGYPSPLAWDDDNIDDPNATPNTGDAQRDAEAREAERLALWKRGMTDRQIAAATGWHRDSVRRWRLRHGLPSQERRAAS